MDVIDLLKNTEKSLNKGGEYCAAFDLIVYDEKATTPEKIIKSLVAKKRLNQATQLIVYAITTFLFAIFLSEQLG